MLVTTADKKLSPTEPIIWQQSSAQAADTIVLTPQKTYQSIHGFGGAFTDSACYMFDKLPAPSRDKLFKHLFGDLGLNVGRTCIGSSDYATKPYSYCDGDADPELQRFSIAHDRQYILPILRQAKAVNPELSFFSSPWSPPGWMKSNNSLFGGNMQRKHMPSYAKYFAKFLKAYEAEGVPIEAVTVQNEVDTDQDGYMPACSWPQEYEVDFVTHHLGPVLQKEGIKTKVWILDHNYNLWGRAIASLEAADLRKYVSGIAWHGYGGTPDKMTVVRDAYPSIEAHWTEGGPDVTDPHYASDWAKWSMTFTGILRNWSRSITVWNLALDEKGKPNIGPFPCGGLVTINSSDGKVSYSGQYFALAHYSKHIKRGALRIDSAGEITDIGHVAFKNPDGKYAVVLTNTGAARAINLQMDNQVAKVDLPPNSVTTLVW